ncbi:MAG: c-type cytochrome [Terriglobales bacterium]
MERNETRIVSKVVLGLLGVLALGLASVPAAADDAGALYKTKCAVCHGADGKGDTNIGKMYKVQDLSAADVQKQSDAELTGIITNGKGKMPAYGKSLKPDQVTGLVSYIRSLAKK